MYIFISFVRIPIRKLCNIFIYVLLEISMHQSKIHNQSKQWCCDWIMTINYGTELNSDEQYLSLPPVSHFQTQQMNQRAFQKAVDHHVYGPEHSLTFLYHFFLSRYLLGHTVNEQKKKILNNFHHQQCTQEKTIQICREQHPMNIIGPNVSCYVDILIPSD